MKENYTYACLFEYSDDYVNIEFPMFDGAFGIASVEENPVEVAQDILAMKIKDLLDNNKPLPDEKYIPSQSNRYTICFINVWMPFHTQKIKEVYIKKTLTIPSWLDLLAKQANLNFSSVLVKGLKKELNID